jgi:aminoglycoside phosphotransferase (APT) family kinase protein
MIAAVNSGFVRWLRSGSAEELARAVRDAEPSLAGLPVTPRGPLGQEDPKWWSANAWVGEDVLVKYAWSQPAAERLAHEIGVLSALARSQVPFLPEVVAASLDPVLLFVRRVAGSPLFGVVDAIDRDQAGAQLARFMAALHSEATRELLARTVPGMTSPVPQATTAQLRERFPRLARPGQRASVRRWCDWTDQVLSVPADAVAVHADLHGDNMVWDGVRLRAVLDFETVGLADPEYDLRAFPGPGLGPGLELFLAMVRHYERLTGRAVRIDRAMAWHVRTALGDALWHTEAGIPLPDHRTPPEWVDDVASRFAQLGMDP